MKTNIKFLLLVIFFYLILFLFNSFLFYDAIAQFFKLIIEILPVFILVFVFIFLSNLFLKRRKVLKIFGKDPGLRGWLLTILSGVLLSGPIYLWYPLLADLKQKGMNPQLMVAFLYSRSIKIPLIPMMVYYFDWLFVCFLIFYMIVFSIINGVLAGFFLNIKINK